MTDRTQAVVYTDPWELDHQSPSLTRKEAKKLARDLRNTGHTAVHIITVRR